MFFVCYVALFCWGSACEQSGIRILYSVFSLQKSSFLIIYIYTPTSALCEALSKRRPLKSLSYILIAALSSFMCTQTHSVLLIRLSLLLPPFYCVPSPSYPSLLYHALTTSIIFSTVHIWFYTGGMYLLLHSCSILLHQKI